MSEQCAVCIVGLRENVAVVPTQDFELLLATEFVGVTQGNGGRYLVVYTELSEPMLQLLPALMAVVSYGLEFVGLPYCIEAVGRKV